MEEWICSCGQKNTSKFCTRCGNAKPEDSKWICSCGQVNTTKFCTVCGKPAGQTDSIEKSSAYSNKENLKPVENKKNYTVIGLICVIGVLIVSIGYLLFKTPQSEEVAEKPSQATDMGQEMPHDNSSITEKDIEPAVNVDKNAWKKDALALNDIYIGDSKEKVYSVLGLESAIIDPEMKGNLHYQYPNIEVVLNSGKVVALISKDAYSSTPLNIHQGSSIQDVFSAYGQADSKFNHNGMILYEYKKISSSGQNCLLRFAVQNDVVNYISIRVTDSLPTNLQIGARETFNEYYELISNKRYSEAYQILSTAQQNRRGKFSDFVQSYKNTVSNKVIALTTKIHGHDGIVFDYALETKDRLPNGRIKVQNFQGTVTMIHDGSRWFIDYAKSSKFAERIE